MREQGSGHILQFSSVGGRIGPIGRAAYAAAKWGVEGFSEVLSKEVGPLACIIHEHIGDGLSGGVRLPKALIAVLFCHAGGSEGHGYHLAA
jgi:hypothetical protein